jgi:putative membrane protein
MLPYDSKSWWLVFRVQGTVLPRVIGRVLFCAVVGGLLVVARSRGLNLAIPATAHGIVGVALGLLLVFRTNASYDRFWEGRKLIGGIVNRTRNLARQACVHIAGHDPRARELKERICGLTISLYLAIRQYLRDERRSEEFVRLSEWQRRALDEVSVPPQAINLWLGAAIAEAAAEGRLSDPRLQMLEENLTALCDLWGGAERIHKTPVPFAYAHHIKGFLLVFCLTVPFALLETMGTMTPVATAIVAYGLFGIEEIGVEIEDPFGYDINDLPLDAVAQTIKTDVEQTLGAKDEPAAAQEEPSAELPRIARP